MGKAIKTCKNHQPEAGCFNLTRYLAVDKHGGGGQHCISRVHVNTVAVDEILYYFKHVSSGCFMLRSLFCLFSSNALLGALYPFNTR